MGVHVKAMRIFVESVLRFGMPAKFASFIITPPANKIPAARKALATVLGSQSQMAGHSDDKEDNKDDDEEFFPYVSLSFTSEIHYLVFPFFFKGFLAFNRCLASSSDPCWNERRDNQIERFLRLRRPPC